MKLVLRSLIVVAAILVGVVVWLRNPESDAASAAPQPAVVEPSKSSVAPDALQVPDEPQVREETERTETATAATKSSTAAATTTAATTATIRVRVVTAETNEPLAGRHVYAITDPAPQRAIRSSKGTRAALGESAVSDSEGRVELEVEPGKAHRVRYSEESGGASVAVAALEAGATDEIVVRIPTRADASFFGRVVDAQTRQPLVSARFRVDASPTRSSAANEGESVDPNGEFELRYRSWADHFVRVEAEGYAWAAAALGKEHLTRETALEIPLARSATLEVLVLEGAQLLAGAKVRAATEAYRMSVSTGVFYFGNEPHWSATSESDGVARLVALAPNAPLKLEVAHGSRKQTLGTPLTLEPGETRRIEMRFGAGATIRGRVETSSGAPLADVEMWRVVAERSSRSLLEDHHKPVATTRSDAGGHFAFEDVAAGDWWIGVAPKRSDSFRERPGNPRQLAPVAEPVAVTSAGGAIDVVVRTDEGVFIRGRVFDSSGSAASCMVFAQSADSSVFVYERSESDGTFRLGPVPIGEYRVQASAMPGGPSGASDSSSVEVSALAGVNDLELHLLPGASVSASLIGPDGAPIDGELRLYSTGPTFHASMTSTREGRGRFDGVPPGTYRLSASTSGGLFASRGGIVARTGAAAEKIELRLEPGAILELKYAGPTPVESYSIFVDGECVAFDGVEKGAITRFVAPAGAVEVRKHEREGEAREVHQLTLKPGETRQLVVGK